jgi:hypothetical protein
MSAKKNGTRPRRTEPKSDPAVSYDQFKEYEGRKYTGMKVGRSHKWHYDQGEWRETKVTPDLWQISYAVNKRRAGKAPEGSGVPVGTEYHWYVLAHQNVSKISANDYTTTLYGLKYKIAHRRAGSEKWSATPRTQRKRMIEFLRGVIADLEAQQEEGTRARGKGEDAAKPEAKASARKRASAKATSRAKAGAQLELAPITLAPSGDGASDGKEARAAGRTPRQKPATPPSMKKRSTRRRKSTA